MAVVSSVLVSQVQRRRNVLCRDDSIEIKPSLKKSAGETSSSVGMVRISLIIFLVHLITLFLFDRLQLNKLMSSKH